MMTKVTMMERSRLPRVGRGRKGKHLQLREIVEGRAKKGGKEIREENEKPKKRKIEISGGSTSSLRVESQIWKRAVRQREGKSVLGVCPGRGRDQIRRVPQVPRLPLKLRFGGLRKSSRTWKP